ncbi:MAG: efflux RND transporter periplasmic adaptor subunit [Oligoflexia bacterium]|nr:efflux RND transporter periplasmic adaptor subunit [Oligoflexia bacterium]
MILSLIIATFVYAQPETEKKELAKVIVQEIQYQDDLEHVYVPVKVAATVQSYGIADSEGLVVEIVKPLGTSVKSGETILFIQNKDPNYTYAKVPVRALVTGVVTEVFPTLMAKVNKGDRLFTVTNLQKIKLLGEVASTDLKRLSRGQAGIYKKQIKEKDGLSVSITAISPVIDPNSGTAAIEFELKDKKELPILGQVGHVLIELTNGKVISVPENAISYQEGKPLVKVLNEAKKVEKREIKISEQRESNVLIESGLSSGDQIIIRSSKTTKPGDSVEVESSK